MTDKDEKTDLNTLFPGREVVLMGETLTIMPFKFGQFPKVSKCLAPIAKAVREAQREDSLVGDGTPLSWTLLLPQVLAHGGDALLDLMGYVTTKQPSWIAQLDMDEGAKLVKAVFDVNADFFKARIAPLMPAASIPQLKPETGAPLSPDSSEPGTPGPTSSNTP